MNLSDDFLRALAASTNRSSDPLRIVWPVPNNPAAIMEFVTFAEWKDFVLRLGLQRRTPEIVRLKYERAHKLYLLAWLDFDLIKAGELIALTTLELALTDRYGDKVRDKKGQISFSRLLRYLPDHDGLSDAKLPMVQRSGGTAIEFLTGKAHPSLNEIRNSLAHGYPFDGLPYGGLLELVRDLIEYAYRDWP